VWAIHFSLCAFFSSKIWFSFTAPASVLLWLLIRPSIPCAPAELFLLIAFHSRSALRGCDFLLCPAPVVLQLDLSFGLVLRFSRSISPIQKFYRYCLRSLGESGFKVSTCRPLHSLLVHSAPAHTVFLPSVVRFGHSTSQDQVFLCCLSTRRLRFFLCWIMHCPLVSASVLDPAAGSLVLVFFAGRCHKLSLFLDFSAPILITGDCWLCLHPILSLRSNSQLLVVANFGQLGGAVGNIFLWVLVLQDRSLLFCFSL
jgi:hypothetical protein